MSLSATDSAARTPRRGLLTALLWMLAGAACAGSMWFCGAAVSFWFSHVDHSDFTNSDRRLARISLLFALVGGICGVLAGVVLDLRHRYSRRDSAKLLMLSGLLSATVSGLTIPVIILCAKWLHPLVSSSLLWALFGAITALCGFAARGQDRSSRTCGPVHFFTALMWGVASAVFAGGAWAIVLTMCQSQFDLSFVPDDFPNDAISFAILLGAIGEGYGLLVGALVGFICGKEKRFASAAVLGIGGAMFGALGSSLSVFVAAAATPQVHPVVSSSLAWCAVGFVMGVCGYLWSRSTAEHVESLEMEEEEAQLEGPKIEWLLRELKRHRWNRPFVRVLPVVIVSAASLIAAVVRAPSELSLSLTAVGVLGLSVAFILFNQEKRLRTIEDRFFHRRDS